MKRDALLLLVLSVLLVALVLGCGCAGSRTAPPSSSSPQGTPTTTLTGGTGNGARCTALGGDICQVGEDCAGSWLSASDSFACCSKPCRGAEIPSAILTIEPFETLQENEDLGDIL